MQISRTWLAATGIAAAALSWWWTPWAGCVLLALLCVWLVREGEQRHRALRQVLAEAAPIVRPFADDLAIVRHRLKAGEQSLRDRDAEIAQRKQITNAVPDGLFLLDDAGRILWCNQAALVMHALDAFRDMGKPVTQLIRAPEFADYLADESRDEPVVTLGNRSILFHLERGSEGARLLLTRDVTEREKLDRMRRDFVANVSHELRTPLTVVGGFVETLAELPLDETDRARYLQLIGTQTSNMRRLVEDLLTLARLENDQLPPERADVDLAQVARDALGDAQALSAGTHRFEVDIESATVRGSASELRSAVGNLLSNAVRYTPADGTISLTVRRRHVGAEDDGAPGASIVVEVRDTGVGIAAEHIPRLTERFYRVDRSRSRETGGTGLGLAIVKHVAQRHRAKLEIESVVQRAGGADGRHGSTFRLRFRGHDETTDSG